MNLQGTDAEYAVEFRRLAADEWTGVLTAFDDAVIYQTRQYGAERWGARNLSHVVVRRNGGPVAAAQVAEAGAPRLGVGACYVPWGPLCRPRAKGADTEALRRILGAMRHRYAVGEGLCVRLRPQVAAADVVARVLVEEGYGRLACAPALRTLVMDLTLPLDEIWRGTKRTYRQHFRRASRGGLDVAEGSDPALYDLFIGLYDELKARKRFEGLADPRDFARIQGELPGPLRMTTTVCSCRGEPVSALVTSAIGDTAVALFAASSPKGRETCAAYLMWWRALERFKEEGRKRLDLGGIDPENAPGPARFKGRLAGKTGREVWQPGLFEAPGGLASRLCVRAGWRLRKACRRFASAAGRAGRVLARTGRKR
ncbi:MAG: lipid II:glycine glycyltransferase FemX [Planctomycetota bacterium]